MSGLSRRDFLRGTAATAATLSLPLYVRPERAGAARGPGGSPLLVVVFLRGGADGLALLPPVGDRALARVRGSLLPDAPLPLGSLGDRAFGLHPALAPLAPQVDAGGLAAVVGVGLDVPERSHFEAQDLCERGGARVHPQGWLARALAATGEPASAFRAIAAATGRPLALAGDPRALAFERVEDLDLPGRHGAARQALDTLFTAEDGSPTEIVARAGRDALDAVRQLQSAAGTHADAGPGFRGRLGHQLATVARVARADLGLVAACVDVGGWDTHVRQGSEEGSFARSAAELADGLVALTRALDARMDDLLVLVVTEFGRTVEPNGSGGTDHGRASVALALGGNVAGGVHGRWPGIAPEEREEERDVRVTTDLRHVLAEGARHIGVGDLAPVFPGLAFRSTGILASRALTTGLPAPPGGGRRSARA